VAQAGAVQVAGPTESQLREFSRDGYLVVRDAISPDLTEKLVHAADRLMDSNLSLGWEIFQEDGARSYRDCVLLDEVFLELLATPAVFPVIVGILGANIQLLGSQLIYTDSMRPVRTPERTHWHRDRMVAVNDLGGAAVPRLAVKAAYYLTDVQAPDSGMTLFSPGSHRLTEPLRIPPGAIDPPDAVCPDLQPGDAVLFENRTWHCPGFNSTGRVRKAVIMEYGYRWLRRRTREQLIRNQLIEGRDPVTRQLLGDLGPDADFAYARGTGSKAIEEWCARHGLTCEPLRDAPA
jgi:ectoine hydroxylase-related dioxygenase (phytanoyl-CoA dioxygenase family)